MKRFARALILLSLLSLAACAGDSYPSERLAPTNASALQSAAASSSDVPTSAAPRAGELSPQAGVVPASLSGPPRSADVRQPSIPRSALDRSHSMVRETRVLLSQLDRQSGLPVIEPPPRVTPGGPTPAVPGIAGLTPPGGSAAGLIRGGDTIEVRYFRNTRLEGQRYGIGVGDVLRVDVVDHPDVSRDRVLVLPDGHISLPLIGSVRAAGKNVDQLSQELGQRYASERILQPQVTVAVEQGDRRLETLFQLESGGGPASMRIAVTQDGVLALPFIPPIAANQPMATLLQQIRQAYFREFGGRLEVTANVIERGGVPVVYVMGEVKQPVTVPHNSALNPMMAVAAAGGFLNTAEPRDVRVIRLDEQRNYVVHAFDFESNLDGKSRVVADFRLQPQDVVYVRPSGVSEANRWVEQYIVRMLPFNFGMNVVFAP